MAEMDGQKASSRHYGLDWLRICAFGLLLLHHTAMVFVPGDWLIKVPKPVEAVVWPMLLIQPWRMPLLFMVSGYATHRLLARAESPGAFLTARSLRLLLPALFGLLFVVPPEIWVALVTFHHYPRGLLAFWRSDWFGFAPIGGLALPNLGHLWFLTYLWTYTAVLVAFSIAAPASLRARLAALPDILGANARLLWLPLLLLMPIRLALLFTIPETSGWLHDWVSDLLFVPAFLLGFALAGHQRLWAALSGARLPAALLALTCALVMILVQATFPYHRGHLVQALNREAQFAFAWSMILVLLAFADARLNREHRWRRQLNEAVFPCYVAHQTLIVVAAWRLIGLGVRGLPLAAAILLVTLAGSWLFYEAGRRSGPLRPLFGLAPGRRKPTGCEGSTQIAAATV